MRGLASPAPAHPAAPWLPYHAGRPNIWRKSYPSIHSRPASVKLHIACVAAILSCVHALREMPCGGGSSKGDVGAVGRGGGRQDAQLERRRRCWNGGSSDGSICGSCGTWGWAHGRQRNDRGRVGVGLGAGVAATAVGLGLGTVPLVRSGTASSPAPPGTGAATTVGAGD